MRKAFLGLAFAAAWCYQFSARISRPWLAFRRSAPRAHGAPPIPSRSSRGRQGRGVELKFADAQQKQENQIKAIRSFIAQKVDVIAFSPVVETGWDTVLREAKAADIPVVLSDRAVDSKDDSLYVTFIGSDFVEEGRRPADWLAKDEQGQAAGQHRSNWRARPGSAPAIDRKKGFEEVSREKSRHENRQIPER